MARPRAILFDIGSTLWESPAEHPDALAYCYGRARQVLEEAMREPPSLELLIETVEGYLAEWEDIWRREAGRVQQGPTTEFVADALKRIGVSLAPRPLAAFTDAVMETSVYTAKTLAPEAGMREALAALKQRRLSLACVSNAFMPAHVLHRIMEERGYGAYLDFTVSSCDLGYRKPHPIIYQAALDKAGTTASETIFAGDRLDADIEGPAALGMLTVLSHQYRKEDPATVDVKPDRVIAHLSELVTYVDELMA